MSNWPPLNHQDVQDRVGTAVQTADLPAGVRAVTPAIRTVTAGTTLVLSDDVVRVNSASPATVTVPNNTSVAFDVGYVAQVRRVGAGSVTVAAASGVTINGTLTGVPQNGSYALMKVGTNEWDIEGGI